MNEFANSLLGAAAFVPHGYCLLWRPDLVALHVVADGLTALAYLSIPAAIVVFVRERPDLEYRWVAWLFALFITACAGTHLIDAATLWQPVYGLQGMAKLATGLISAATALVLWQILPRLVALPSPAELQRQNAALEAEVARRAAAEAELRAVQGGLEARVRARTQELEAANAALRASEARLAHMARHDPLTGLPNRVLFRELLERERERADRHGGRFALLMADLDGFKAVNDRLGHAAGDALLGEVGRRLSAAVREGDVVARLGGDEFAVLVGAPGDGEALAALAGRLVDACARPFDLGGCDARIGISVGAALYPDDGTDLDVLLEHADLALYAVKADGRSASRRYGAGMWQQRRERRLRPHRLLAPAPG
jgi:diguanylate cyclase (GGDEF)-like protein